MVRVLQIGAFPFPSHQGSQVYVGGMVRALASAGAEVALATYGYGVGDWPRDVARVPVRDVPLSSSLASGPSLSKVVRDALLADGVRRWLRRHPVDLIHAHNVEAPLAGWLGSALASSRVPLLYNLHTSLEEELPVYLGGRRRKVVAARLGRRVDRELARRADGCVAISRRARDVLKDWGAADVAYLPPGIDPADLEGGDRQRAAERWDLGDRRWIVYTGNADPYQDLQVLFDAVARLEDAGLLVVTGSSLDGPRAWAAQHGLPPERLRLVESRSFDDVRDALVAGSVAALPRATCAGFPIKLLNYLGAGLPTVCAAGSSQPIEGVVTVPNGNPTAMADAFRSLLRTPSITGRLGIGAARAIRSRWTWDKRAQELLTYYQTVLERT